MEYDLIIIGGGASGCMAAAAAAGSRVLLIEPSRFMHKLALTGKGRCNLTNNSTVSAVLANIPKNAAFMHSCLSRFSPADTIAFFENLGVELKTERGGRVFPASDKSADIVNALRRRMDENGVVTAKDRAVGIIVENNVVKGVTCEKNSYYGKNALLATGGVSYPATGSTGDGYVIARKAGHAVTDVKPSLVPLVTVESCADKAGLSLRNIRLTLLDGGRKLFSEQGEMLFTHFGVSGPLVLSASQFINGADYGNYRLSIDLKPALDPQKLDSRLLRDFAELKNKRFKNALNGLLPEKLIADFTERTGIAPDKRVNEITKAERGAIAALLKDYRLTVKAFRPIDEAIVTDGGVSVKEIDPKTMQSRLVKGLYFAGEIIDVTGFTGGFNLQIAFSTAVAAARGIDEKR